MFLIPWTLRCIIYPTARKKSLIKDGKLDKHGKPNANTPKDFLEGYKSVDGASKVAALGNGDDGESDKSENPPPATPPTTPTASAMDVDKSEEKKSSKKSSKKDKKKKEKKKKKDK
jgi:H/ACA ribonucleoprotein complex subunit 4